MGKNRLIFNPDRVLRDTPKLVAALTVPNACEVDAASYPQGEAVEMPITSVTSEALMLLQTLIDQDAHALDETSKQRDQRHLQKFANAAQIFFAERNLQRDQIHFLAKMNKEANRRKSTKSTIVGKAKVRSCEDIVKAREERAAKEAKNDTATAGKVRRGRKRKTSAPETEPKAKVALMSEAPTEIADRQTQIQLRCPNAFAPPRMKANQSQRIRSAILQDIGAVHSFPICQYVGKSHSQASPLQFLQSKHA